MRSLRTRRLPVLAVCWTVALGVGAGSAQADVASVFNRLPGSTPGSSVDNTAHAISCTAQSDGVRFCPGSASTKTPCQPGGGSCAEVYDPSGKDTRVPTFDGVPIDVNVTLPAAPSSGPDGGYPLVIVLHGYGGSKKSLDSPEDPWFPSAHEWAKMGYAVVNMTDRGFGDSCGSAASRQAAVITAAAAQNPSPSASCQNGWIKLLDLRFEVHDAQYLAGLLVDQGLADPRRIGAMGESYGGGASMDLASLKDRILNADGSVVPWTSPIKATPIKLAGATPTIPWTDLISSLTPNGRGSDAAITKVDTSQNPPGVEKQSFVAGLYATGQASGYYAPPKVDDTADLNTWFPTINAGEPYDPSQNPGIGPIFYQFRNFKGPYYVLQGTADNGKLSSEAPAPLLMSNGFTDDLFPVDETVRYYNLMRTLYPQVPASLMYFDYGHMRGTNKTADMARLKVHVVDWFNHYVRGDGPDPGQYVEALTQTCPSKDGAGNFTASGGPFTAASWFGLHPGALLYSSKATQTIQSTGGDPSVAKSFDPVAGGGACASAPAADEPNSANYTLPAATGDGYTMLGSPTVVASMSVTGTYPEIVTRLVDVAPDGTETLVARSTYRPVADGKPEVFQLHPGAWRFAPGHRPKLQLLGRDVPYARASNGTFSIDVSGLSLFLPTHETSGNGIVPVVATPIPRGFQGAPGVPTVSIAAFKGFTRPPAASCRPSHVSRKAVRKRSTHHRRHHRHSSHARAAKRAKHGARHHRARHHAAKRKSAAVCAPAGRAKPGHKHRTRRRHKKTRHARTAAVGYARRP